MGYRIKRSIGWGMPWDTFVKVCQAPDKTDVSEWMYDLFGKLTDEDLTIDDKLYRALFYGNDEDRDPIIFQKRLLALSYDHRDKEPQPVGRAGDLYSISFDGDDYSDIIFYPNLIFEKRWHRRDDDMDYAFEAVRGDDGNPCETVDGGEPRNFTVYKRYGHYPWANHIMDHNGKSLKWEHYALLNQRNDWVPGVPTEIRWYLTQHGVMFNEGVNQLRPIVSQWWS